jgi:hypothetical protein
MADLIILTKATKEIAGTEKDGSGAVAPHQRPFLSVMNMDACDNRIPAGSADASFIRIPVHMTFPGTQIASLQMIQNL